MGLDVSILHRVWSYEDVLSLPDDGYRYEVLDGHLTVTPPPSVLHQDVLENLRTELSARVPADWRLTTGVGVRTRRRGPERYVIPDPLAASGPRPERYYEPEAVRLVVEVASASTELRDAGSKKALYEAHGIPTYLLVDPAARTLVAWELEGGAYRAAWRMTDDVPGRGLLAGVRLGELTAEPR